MYPHKVFFQLFCISYHSCNWNIIFIAAKFDFSTAISYKNTALIDSWQKVGVLFLGYTDTCCSVSSFPSTLQHVVFSMFFLRRRWGGANADTSKRYSTKTRPKINIERFELFWKNQESVYQVHHREFRRCTRTKMNKEQLLPCGKRLHNYGHVQ